MKKSPIILIVLIFLFGGFNQTDQSFKLNLPDKNCRIKTDGFGNIYVIHEDEIIKYNSSGILQKKFSTKRYGKIDLLDPTNPLKILVYYRDFQQIVFLDNQLTVSSDDLSLEKIGYEQAGLVCTSANNGFWLYDRQNNELVRFGSDLKPLVKTGNLKQILGLDIKPDFMKEHNSYLYLNCPDEGILVFDIYGTFNKTLPLRHLAEFDIVNGNVVYFENRTLKEYQSQTFNTVEKPFEDTLLKTVYWQNNRFYKVYSDSLLVQ